MIRKEDLKDLFSFSSGEKKGIGVLIVLIITLGAGNAYDWGLRVDPVEVDHTFRKEVEQFLFAQNQSQEKRRKDSQFYSQKSPERKENKAKINLFKFNPNTISLEEWTQLGLSEKQAQVILNYKEKGGRFAKKSDLKKMFTVSDKQYELWEDFIDLPKENVSKKQTSTPWEKSKNESIIEKDSSQDIKTKTVKKKMELHSIELNIADTTLLKTISGIGSFYAKMIVEYRNKLGGFHSIDQLYEVPAMRTETVIKIEEFLRIDENKIQRIKINEASYEQLKAHPYLSYKEAKSIVNYRKQHFPLKDKRDLEKIILLKVETLKKIAPYLSYDN